LIPFLDAHEDLLLRLLARSGRPLRRFIDLGAGDGALAEIVLAAHPKSSAVLVDYSEPMINLAAKRLGGYNGRWRAEVADLSQVHWVTPLTSEPYDAIVSAFCIHHLPAERKKALFREVFGLLAAGGLFLNCDYTLSHGLAAGMFDEQMITNLIEAEQRSGGERSPEQVRRDFLEGAHPDEDRPDTPEDQVCWLREAGFERADVFFKWTDSALFGGAKPEGES
jgi:ubiquinone/menaquinone biosynthesis C-methylase UbiE